MGVVLVRRARYRAHGAAQTTVLVVTLVLTVVWMAPAFHETYGDALSRRVVNRVSIAVAAHVVVGTLALLLGVWVVLVAGTSLVPARWLAIVLGVVTYWLSTH